MNVFSDILKMVQVMARFARCCRMEAWKMMVSLLVLTIVPCLLHSQVRVQGKVIDVKTGEPLSGATVRGVGSGEGAYTNAFGEFNLRTKADALRVTFIGYKPFIVEEFDPGETLLVALSPRSDTLATALVRALPTPVNLNIAAPVSEIPAAALQRDSRVSLTPALNRVPGVFVHRGAFNTNRITIRGVGSRSPFSTTKVRAYLNDIPLTTGEGETTLEDIDLSIIEDVRVWKGPTASVYGAGLGGMIHLRTRELGVGAPTRLSVSETLGSYGLDRTVADFQYNNDEGDTQFNLNYNRTQDNGYRENNAFRREALTAYGQFRSGERDRTSFIASYRDVKAFIPSSLTRQDFENNPQMAAPNWAAIEGFEDYQQVLVGVSHRHDFIHKSYGENFSNTTTFFTSYRNNFEPRPFNILREDNRAVGFRTTFDYRKSNNRERPDISVGAEYFREQYDWQTNEIINGELDTLLTDNLERRRYYNLFAEANYSLNRYLFVTGGINYNQTRYELEDRFPGDGVDISSDQDFEGVLSPRLSIGFQPLPRLTLFASYSRGFSPPTSEETRTPDGRLNTDLQPERGGNLEFGMRGAYFRRLTFDISYYRMNINDLLVARRTAQDQFVGVNAGETSHRGWDVYFAYSITDQLEVFTSYTRAKYRFEEFQDQGEDFSGNQLTGAPPHKLSAGIDFFPAKGFYGNLNFLFVDAMPVNDANTTFSEAFRLVRLRLGYRKNFGKHIRLDTFLGINNLFDEDYAAMLQINAMSFNGGAPRYFYPGRPRNYYGGVKVGYLFGE